MSKGTTSRNIRIDDVLWTRARAQAAAEGRDVSKVVRDALTAYTSRPADADGHVYAYDLLSPYPDAGTCDAGVTDNGGA